MNPTTTTGTSLEVLAPYLPYGIELRRRFGNSRIKGKMFQLGTNPNPPYLAWASIAGRDSVEFLRDCLPVLRPFKQLQDRLPDGTTPLFEAAKLSFETRYGDLFFGSGQVLKVIDGKAWDGSDNPEIVRYEVWGENTACALFSIHSDWTITTQIGGPLHRIIDYLRSQHFAIGLEPHQFIAK